MLARLVHLALLALTPFLAAQEPAERVVARHSPFDLDGDGTVEIGKLEVLGEAGDPRAPRVVILVEHRLLAPRDGISDDAITSLRARLLRLADDLAAEGRRATLVAATVHRGERHQDGRTVLALRRVLRAFAAAGPLEGALLVGHFPDALLLRTCNWRRRDAVHLDDRDGENREFTGYLRAVPENVAWKCDLVLADLDGGWEDVYFEAERDLPSLVAAFDGGAVPAGGGAAVAWQERGIRYRDAFHLADGRAELDPATGAVTIDDDDRDHECTPTDRDAANPIARPDIAVSRIDARGVAWSPPRRLLDDDGRPRPVTFADDEPLPEPRDLWIPDPALEMQLLVEHLDRNHAFRTTPLDPAADRPASVAFGLASGFASMRAARPQWRGALEPELDRHGKVDLLALLDWWRRPAVLRTLRAHSDPFHAAFARTDAARLLAAVGTPWAFVADGRKVTPSLADLARHGRADLAFYRTLWANDLLPDQPHLLVHTGCEAISPRGATTLRYDDPRYGALQQAEAILFHTPCVALIGRAKVFYDEPHGFAASLATGATVGEAWQRTFALEAASTWREAGGDIGRKRAYFWSLLGDFTLRLP